MVWTQCWSLHTWVLDPSAKAVKSHVGGGGEETQDKRTLLRCFFPFFFLHKNSPFIQVFSSTSTLERSFIIFFWAQKNVMKAELTDFLHLLYALTSLIIS